MPEYYEQTLLPQHIPALMELQRAIEVEKPYHMKPWSQDDLEDHFSLGMPIVGIFDADNNLVAATILAEQSNPAARRIKEYPQINGEDVVIMKAFCVHPDHARKGLPHMLEAKARELYPDSTLMAKIAVDNYASLDSFIGRGFRRDQPIHKTTSYYKEGDMYYDATFLVKRPETYESLVLVHGNTRKGGFQLSADV